MYVKVTLVLFCLFVIGKGVIGNKWNVAYDAVKSLSNTFSGNITQARRLIKFEDEFDSNYVSFDDQNLVPNASPVKFGIGEEPSNLDIYPNDDKVANNVKFDDIGQEITDNRFSNPSSNGSQPSKGKKKRRRRKPRKQFPAYPGLNRPVPGLSPSFGPIPGPNQNFGPIPGLGQNFGLIPGPAQNFGPIPGPGQNFGSIPGPGQNFGPIPGPGQNFGPNNFQTQFNGQFNRPPRRPQASVASDALTAVTGALTSIAHNDDYQCVARLLCEAAAGGALGGSSLLESVSGLQPLLTLLSAYNGISSNPLFVFGRAAFLGMSSKSNPGSCRYAYPLCPTDPEQLVHYLNNHNGGFFRFFNAPQLGQQNLEQFYNQLSQNYGLYQPSSGNNQEFYGLLNPGSYPNPAGQANLYPNDYGYQQNYGLAYPYNQNHNNGNEIRFKNNDEFNNDVNTGNVNEQNKIEKRIQNKPASFLNDNTVTSNSKWLFPGEDDDYKYEKEIGVQYVNYDDFGVTDNRKGKTLKFPDVDTSYDNDNQREYYKQPINIYTTQRTPKGIYFPENQRNLNDYETNKYYTPVHSNGIYHLLNNINKGFNDRFKGVTYNNNNNNNYQEEPGVTTVYVVRGNNDPSKPEIVKLRPGETL